MGTVSLPNETVLHLEVLDYYSVNVTAPAGLEAIMTLLPKLNS